jgi:ubiquinone/menaquinone biosynthesis C-methylase UbiE
MERGTVTLALEVGSDPAVAFGLLVDELTAALARIGIEFDAGEEGRILESGFEVGRVVTWEPNHALLRWRAAEWDPDDETELEIRSEPIGEVARLTIEHRGFGGQFWAGQEIVGWFADQVAAPFLSRSAPRVFGNWLTDRAARRPSGDFARESYRDPTHHRPSFEAVLAALQPGPEDVLLEIGCGGGAFLARALGSGCRAAAVDHSTEMVRVARELNADAIADGRLEIVQADAARLPFPDDEFTCAAMMQVFFFLLDPAAVLGECRRVVRENGRFAVFTVSEEARGTPAAPEPMASRCRFYTDEELVQLARGAGFAEATVERPDLEPHAREAGLPEDVIALFAEDRRAGQLLVAR